MLVALLLTACGTTFKTAEEKAAYQAKLAQEVVDKVNDCRFTIDVTYMKPRGGMVRQSVTGFSLELKGDTVVSYLPYFGAVTGAIFGGNSQGLNFTGPVENYTVTTPKADLVRIIFNTQSKEDRYRYMVEIFTNGRSTINVIGDDHQSIDFDGDMKLNY